MKKKKFSILNFTQIQDTGLIVISLNIEKLPNYLFSFSEDGSLESIIFLVRGIVDKTNDITNIIVRLTKLQKVILDSSSSPNEMVR